MKSEDNYHITTRKRKKNPEEKKVEEKKKANTTKKNGNNKRNKKESIENIAESTKNNNNLNFDLNNNNNNAILINETQVVATKNPLDLLSEALMYEEESTPQNSSGDSERHFEFINHSNTPNSSFNQEMLPSSSLDAVSGFKDPYSINNLKLEIDFLSSEISKMKEDFKIFQKIFESNFLKK